MRTAHELVEILVDPHRAMALVPSELAGRADLPPLLLTLLEHADAVVRRNAALACGWIGHPDDEALRRLTGMLEDPSEIGQTAAAYALLVLGAALDAPLARLSTLRQHPDFATRSWAVSCLIEALPARPAVLPAALELLDDRSAETLEELGLALGRCDLATTLPPLLDRLQRGAPDVQHGALTALAVLTGDELARPFTDAITDAILAAGLLRSPSCRWYAAITIRHLAPDRADVIAELATLLDRDPHGDAGEHAAHALIAIPGTPPALRLRAQQLLS